MPLGHFSCGKFLKSLESRSWVMRAHVICGPEMIHLPQTRIFSRKPLFNFHVSWSYFSLYKIFSKNPWIRSEATRSLCCHFGPKMDHCPEQCFWFGKITNLIFMYILAFFTVKNFRKILEADIEDTISFVGPNGTLQCTIILIRKNY